MTTTPALLLNEGDIYRHTGMQGLASGWHRVVEVVKREGGHPWRPNIPPELPEITAEIAATQVTYIELVVLGEGESLPFRTTIRGDVKVQLVE